MQPALSVIIPAYNEEQRLSSSLSSIYKYAMGRMLPTEILVVDDASTDRTIEIVEQSKPSKGSAVRVQVLRNTKNLGKGASVRRGMLKCKGKLALMTDADMSTPIEELEKLERVMSETNCDIAIGSRAIEGSRVEVHQSRIREKSGELFNVVVRGISSLSFKDTQCGFKLFSMQKCRPVFAAQLLAGYSFDVEILYIADELGLEIREVPVIWRHAAGSKVRFFRDGSKMLTDLLKVRWHSYRGRYTDLEGQQQ
jgi:dolichyl-phosphate beta-glucosyltransferase